MMPQECFSTQYLFNAEFFSQLAELEFFLRWEQLSLFTSPERN